MPRYDNNNKSDSVIARGVSVELRNSESIESLIRRFKKKVIKSEILREYRDKTEYLKPSVKKRKKSIDARRRDERERSKLIKEMSKKKKKKEPINNEIYTSSIG
jgi:small subunit ribosomal protein S21